MHTKSKLSYILFALVLGLVGCFQEEYPFEPVVSSKMSFKVERLNADSGVNSDGFKEGDQLGFYVVNYTNTYSSEPLQPSGNYVDNAVMKYSNKKWTSVEAIYWNDGCWSDVYAYYPFMDIVDIDKQPFSVATDQTDKEAYRNSDFLWGKATKVSRDDGDVSLELGHSMSRIIVKIKKGAYTHTVDGVPSVVDSIKLNKLDSLKNTVANADALRVMDTLLIKDVSLQSIVPEALVSLANGSVVTPENAEAGSIKMLKRGINIADGSIIYEAIIVPQSLETSKPLLEIQSEGVSNTLSPSKTIIFEQGKTYIYTARFDIDCVASVTQELAMEYHFSTTAIAFEEGEATIDDWNGLEAQNNDIDLASYTDLSTAGTANCYLIKEAGKYKFKAVEGNSNISISNVKTAEVLWESFGTDKAPNVGDLVTGVGYKDGYVYFSTPAEFKNGNASIAVRNSTGEILWSWHIWCSEEGWKEHTYAHGGIMMDRNLGATSATPGNIGALGLLYQWGRKDPFMGSDSTAIAKPVKAKSTGTWNTISSSQNKNIAEECPMSFATDKWCGGNGNVDGWHTSEMPKGIYDPCPVGYRVPDGGENGFWAKAQIKSTGDSKKFGMLCTTYADGKETKAWYPATGYLGNNTNMALCSVGGIGYCWTATPYSDNKYLAYCFNFNIAGDSFPENYYTRGSGYSVRCVKE